MKLRQEKWQECPTCNRRDKIIQDEAFGCDECEKPIDLNGLNPTGRHREHLEVSVFRNNGRTETQHLQFCSWRCVLKHLPKIRCDYFVTLPFLHYDKMENGNATAKAFLKELKRR